MIIHYTTINSNQDVTTNSNTTITSIEITGTTNSTISNIKLTYIN